MALATELMPEARATIVAGVGRIAGALAGIPVYQYGGIHATSVVSVLMSFIGLISLSWGLTGRIADI